MTGEEIDAKLAELKRQETEHEAKLAKLRREMRDLLGETPEPRRCEPGAHRWDDGGTDGHQTCSVCFETQGD